MTDKARMTHPATLCKLLVMLLWAVKSLSMTVPRTELKTAFMTMYEEYKNAMTAPRAETSVYLWARGDHWRLYSNVKGRCLP